MVKPSYFISVFHIVYILDADAEPFRFTAPMCKTSTSYASFDSLPLDATNQPSLYLYLWSEKYAIKNVWKTTTKKQLEREKIVQRRQE
jgi:hypothetical protein